MEESIHGVIMYQLEVFNKRNGASQSWKGSMTSVLKEGCVFLRGILSIVDPEDIKWKMWNLDRGVLVFELDEGEELI